MTIFIAPGDLMREIAHTMGTDTENLLIEQQEHWQKMQTAISSLPTSVQSFFNTFQTSNGSSLVDALTLRQQIGQALYLASDLAEGVDHDISQTF